MRVCLGPVGHRWWLTGFGACRTWLPKSDGERDILAGRKGGVCTPCAPFGCPWRRASADHRLYEAKSTGRARVIGTRPLDQAGIGA
jgi:hypothetical protein